MISVVIPSYNRRNCIIKLLRDIFAQEDTDFEVIVVDDCSPDDTVQSVRREFPQVRLIVNERNGGPCVSRNRGIRAAIGRIIVGFDSDVTVPDHHLFTKIRNSYAEYTNVSGFAFRIYLDREGVDDSLRWWHPIPLDRGSNYFFETDYFSGTAYSFRREIMIASGLYLELLYMHYEEVELSLRIINKGGFIFYHPGLIVMHHACEISRNNKTQNFYKPRNQVLLATSCFPVFMIIFYLTPRIVRNLYDSIKNNHLDEFVNAMIDAINKCINSGNHRRPLNGFTLRKIIKLRAPYGRYLNKIFWFFVTNA